MRTFLTAVVLLAAVARGQAQQQPNLMPVPACVQLGSGHLLVTQSFSIAITGHRDATLERGVQRFLAELECD